MKIALYGNVCNNMYSICKAVRLNSNIDAHLYLPDNADFSNLPENDDPELKDNYPNWIHKNEDYRMGHVLKFWKNNLVKELNNYDLVILSSVGVMLSPFLRKAHTIFYATGGDLTVLPFSNIHQTLLYDGKKLNIKPYLYAVLQRLGINKVDKIITQPFYPFVNALKKLDIPKSKVLGNYFPILFNTDLFRYNRDAINKVDLIQKDIFNKHKFIVFHPSRIIINEHQHLKETGQWKNNTLIVKAFAHFLKENKIEDACLLLIERSYGHDWQINEMKAIINRLGLKEQVIWLKPKDKRGFTREELIQLYSLSDVVTDDYGAGWFGSICVEGFSCEKPVVSYVDEKAMEQMYPNHPFLSSNTVEGNAAFFKNIYFDKTLATDLGKKGREWAVNFHSFEQASKIYLAEIQNIINVVSKVDNEKKVKAFHSYPK